MAKPDGTLTPKEVEVLRRIGIDATNPPLSLQAFLMSEAVRRGTSAHRRLRILRRAGEAGDG